MGGFLINIIIGQLNQYLNSVEGVPTNSSTDHVVLGNMAKSRIAGGEDSTLENKIVVSLVSVTEESTIKNKPAFTQINAQGYELKPPVHANLNLLFASNFNDYPSTIDYLFRVIEFFQGKNIFKFKNSPLHTADPDTVARLGEAEISMELLTLSFEQSNDLWGSLGGKQVPFVLYRARLIPVQMALPMARSGLITEIDLKTQGQK